jgi:predicted cupin superfamily sugar epimerase
MKDAKQDFINRLIQHLGLEPLPGEGGLFVEIYKASESIPPTALPERYPSPRAFSTAILYLLTDEPESFSAMHRLLTDEIYHFYLGDPVEMLLLFPDGRSQTAILGPDVLTGQQVQFVVPQGVWQGSHLQPGGSYALIGTTMAPGYENEDFMLGQCENLVNEYPEAAGLIRQLTRP